MKLAVELVPGPLWSLSLAQMLKSGEWDRIRRASYKKAGHKCEVCGGSFGNGRKHPVECHEIWEYNDETRVQKLLGVITLCPPCHEVKHLGRAEATGNMVRAVTHFIEVNGCSDDDALDHIQTAFEVFDIRSSVNWSQDLSWLKTRTI